jgi:hypothetical protein
MLLGIDFCEVDRALDALDIGEGKGGEGGYRGAEGGKGIDKNSDVTERNFVIIQGISGRQLY